MANTDLFLSIKEVRPRLRRSETLFHIVKWIRGISTLSMAAGLILRVATGYRHGITLMAISAAFMAICGFLLTITNNRELRTCSHCFYDLPAKELLSAPDNYCCPHCGAPFQAKIGKDEFQF